MKTVTIKRKNVYLDVAPEAVDSYLAKGYDVVDAYGNVIVEHAPNDITSLKTAYDKHIAEIKALKDRIKELESELANSKKIVKTEKVETAEEVKTKAPKKSKK